MIAAAPGRLRPVLRPAHRRVRPVIAEAAGLAVLAAMSPTALLVCAVYLGTTRPRQTGLYYLAGAVLMSLIMGIVVLLVLRSAGLNHPDQHAPRYGLRLGLGIVLLVAGLVITVRKPRQPDPAKASQGFISGWSPIRHR